MVRAHGAVVRAHDAARPANIDAMSNDACAPRGGMPMSTHVPAGASTAIDVSIAATDPEHSNAKSNPPGAIERNAVDRDRRPARASTCRWRRSATPRRSSPASMSTATIRDARCARQVCNTLTPMPPMPNTTTVAPALTSATLRTEPNAGRDRATDHGGRRRTAPRRARSRLVGADRDQLGERRHRGVRPHRHAIERERVAAPRERAAAVRRAGRCRTPRTGGTASSR